MKLTEEQIKKTYWFHRPDEDFPPNWKVLEEYNGEERLCLFCTKGNETNAQIKRRELTYKEEIPTKLDSLKVLWAYHINQDTFNAICQLKNLESLYIESNKILDVSAISNLKKLKHLALLNLTKVKNIKPIATLTQLQTLSFENLKKVQDFKAISELKNLEGFQLDGDMYTAQIIENFDFLSSLTNLKYLTFRNSRSKIKNFDPLLKLENLEMILSSSNYPKKEFQKLRGLKKLKYIGGNIESLINI